MWCWPQSCQYCIVSMPICQYFPSSKIVPHCTFSDMTIGTIAVLLSLVIVVLLSLVIVVSLSLVIVKLYNLLLKYTFQHHYIKSHLKGYALNIISRVNNR